MTKQFTALLTQYIYYIKKEMLKQPVLYCYILGPEYRSIPTLPNVLLANFRFISRYTVYLEFAIWHIFRQLCYGQICQKIRSERIKIS